MNAADLSELNGKVVLVQSARDHRNPPTGMRGTIRVSDDPRSRRPIVQIELDFPQMFTTRARHRLVTLTGPEVAELVESDRSGAYTVTLDEPLDPEAPAGNE